MNEQSITIRWEKNSGGCTDISANRDIDGYTHFREAFLSLDNIPSVYCVSEKETSGESAGKSPTIALLIQLIGIIRKSDKSNGQIVLEQIQNSKFPLTDLVTIRKFAEIAGIKFDERKFRNRREFRMYVQSLMKDSFERSV